MIENHNPEGPVAVEPTPYAISTTIRGKDGIAIGFLANGFPDSEGFLSALRQEMQRLVPGIQAHFYNKGNASIPASEEMLSELEANCQAVVAAYGH